MWASFDKAVASLPEPGEIIFTKLAQITSRSAFNCTARACWRDAEGGDWHTRGSSGKGQFGGEEGGPRLRMHDVLHVSRGSVFAYCIAPCLRQRSFERTYDEDANSASCFDRSREKVPLRPLSCVSEYSDQLLHSLQHFSVAKCAL